MTFKNHILHKPFSRPVVPFLILTLIAFSLNVSAATIGYWRFEEGTHNGYASAFGKDEISAYTDSSGMGQHMATYELGTSPLYVGDDLPFNIVPQTGEQNTMATKYAKGKVAGDVLSDDVYSHKCYVLNDDSSFKNGWTVEATFKIIDNYDTAYQVIVGKDGDPDNPEDPDVPYFALKYNPIYHQIEVYGWTKPDSLGNQYTYILNGRYKAGVEIDKRLYEDSILFNTWYSVAVVCDGYSIMLYLKGPGDDAYVKLERKYITLSGTGPKTDFGPAFNPWIIGRGYWASSPAAHCNAIIDEVKISDKALMPHEFLGVEPTEPPTTYANNELLMWGANPFILREEETDGSITYYLYSSVDLKTIKKKFMMRSGFGVWKSKDLINWSPCGLAKEGLAMHKDDVWGSDNFWGAEVIKKGDRYYMFATVMEHIILATSDSPCGPFKQDIQETFIEKRTVPAPDNAQWKIDPTILVDDDGTHYLYFCRVNQGNVEPWKGNVINVVKLSDDLLTIDGPIIPLIDAELDWEIISNEEYGETADITEAAYCMKHNGLYYLMYAVNHFHSKYYCMGYAISDNPYGPFIKYPKPFLWLTDDVYGPSCGKFVSSPDNSETFLFYHAYYKVGGPKNRLPRRLALDRIGFEDGDATFNPFGSPEPPDILVVDGPTFTKRHPYPGNLAINNNGGADPVTENSAILNGKITGLGKDDFVVMIYAGDNDGGTNPDTNPADDNTWDYLVVIPHDQLESDGAFSLPTGPALAPNEKYYYRCYATNSGRKAWASYTADFITGLDNPKITDPEVVVIDHNSATFNAVFSGAGDLTVAILFGDEKGDFQKYPFASTANDEAWDMIVPLGTRTAGPFSYTYNDDAGDILEPGKTYYYQYAVMNAKGASHFSEPVGEFTMDFAPPEIDDLGVSEISYNSAVLNGVITYTGGDVPKVTIAYGLDNVGDDHAEWDTILDIGLQAGTFLEKIEGLNTNTKYYYRFAAINKDGLNLTTINDFTTEEVIGIIKDDLNLTTINDFTTEEVIGIIGILVLATLAFLRRK